MSGRGSGLARARERFLDGGFDTTSDQPDGPGPVEDAATSRCPGVRPEIADSWERSRRAGVDASRFAVPYAADLDFGGSLASCARPVLDHLEEQLSGTAVGVVLTDREGRLLDRRVGEGELRRRLDDISLAPGFSYAEQFAGTNGVGTALRGAAAALVVGAEHFTDLLQPFACAGAPVTDPVDGRVVGVVDVTCMAAEGNDLLRVLALQAARDITHVLRERGSAGARAVMAEFQTVGARSPHPVLAVVDDTVIANRAARATLSREDQECLRQRTEGQRTSAACERVLLADGPVRVRRRIVPALGGVAGVILEILPDVEAWPTGLTGPAPVVLPPVRAPRPDRPLTGLAGSSASWRSTGAALRDAASVVRSTLVLGETGTGKESAVRATHQEIRPAARWMVVGGRGAGTGTGRTVAEARTEIEAFGTDPVTVVVRHVEELDAAGTAALASLLARGRQRPWWIVGLVTGDTAEAVVPAEVAGAFTTTVAVDPLRHRSEDVPALVTALLGRLAPARRVRCVPAAEQLLTGARWPGNVTELLDALRRALAARPAGDIEPDDLPSELAHGTRRRLSPLESAERDLIVAALMEARGNRVRAAAALGIGRATLYRRLRAFGITDVGR